MPGSPTVNESDGFRDGGRSLFTTSGETYRAVLWSGGGSSLVATGAVELREPFAAGAPFSTRQVLPVSVEVRPDDPTRNLFTEVTVANLDAERNVVLTLTTANGTYTLPVEIAAGATRVFPNVVQAFRDLGGAALPRGEKVAGTLEATAYDTHATIISEANQDAAFVRALPADRASNLTLPVITDAGGIGTRFTSECALTNTTGGPAVADVTFTSSKSGNTVSDTLSPSPRSTRSSSGRRGRSASSASSRTIASGRTSLSSTPAPRARIRPQRSP